MPLGEILEDKCGYNLPCFKCKEQSSKQVRICITPELGDLMGVIYGPNFHFFLETINETYLQIGSCKKHYLEFNKRINSLQKLVRGNPLSTFKYSRIPYKDFSRINIYLIKN